MDRIQDSRVSILFLSGGRGPYRARYEAGVRSGDHNLPQDETGFSRLRGPRVVGTDREGRRHDDLRDPRRNRDEVPTVVSIRVSEDTRGLYNFEFG